MYMTMNDMSTHVYVHITDVYVYSMTVYCAVMILFVSNCAG